MCALKKDKVKELARRVRRSGSGYVPPSAHHPHMESVGVAYSRKRIAASACTQHPPARPSASIMSPYKDVESSAEPKSEEHEALLPQSDASESEPARTSSHRQCSFASRPKLYTATAFLAGVLSCLAVQYVVCSLSSGGDMPAPHRNVEVFAPPYAGSSEVHHFPPASPTNVFPSLFPTSVGYAGPTPTGAEPALIATAPSYPVHTGAPHLVSPTFPGKGNKTSSKFDLFRHLGNLSPWFSVDRGAFGLDSSPEVPETCRITGLHLLHRHGARYPTQFGQCIV